MTAATMAGTKGRARGTVTAVAEPGTCTVSAPLKAVMAAGVRVSSAATARAEANSEAVANRSAGTRDMARMATASSVGLTSGRVARSGRGVSVSTRDMIA